MKSLRIFLNQNKKNLLVFAAVFTVAAGAGVGYWLYQRGVFVSQQDKAALKIGDHYISKEDYQSYLKGAQAIEDVEEKEFRDRYLSVQRDILAAQDMGVSVEQKAVDKQFKKILTDQFELDLKQDNLESFEGNPWLKLIARQQAVQQAIKSQATNKYQGSLFIFPFDRYLSPSSENFKKFGNQQAIEQDRRYAKQQAEKHHQQLQTNQISSQELLQTIKQDPRLNYMNTTVFGQGEQAWEQDVVIQEVVDFIKTLGQPQVSAIQTGQVETEYNDQGQVTKREDGYFYFVKLDTVAEHKIAPDELSRKASSYQVEWYE